ncbi:hypothetical protein PCYB_007630, partial [Plasmodium cynomolgi strain B]
INSRKFYDKLENIIKRTDSNEYCGTPQNLRYNRNLSDVCSTILINLKNNNVSVNDGNMLTICKLLNYWEYCTLNGLYHSKNGSEIDNSYNVLAKIWKEHVNDNSSEHYYKKYKPDYVHFIYTDWKQKKELYEYYFDIGVIKSTPKFFNTGYDDYYKYVKYKVRLYDYYKNPYSISYNLDCPNFLKECKEYHPEMLLPEFICYQDILKKGNKQAHAQHQTQIQAQKIAPSLPLQRSITETPDSITTTGTKTCNVFLGVVIISDHWCFI